MPTIDKRIDDYIASAQPFAQPVLRHFRKLVHTTCPDVVETIKWRMPFFEYKGTMCHMAAFKQHSVIGFWKASLFKDQSLVITAQSEVAMGHLGKITSLKDLPSDKKLIGYIKEAMQLNEAGAKLPKNSTTSTSTPELPDILVTAFRKNKKAQQLFEAMAPSHRKEYINWLNDAKKTETQERRLAKMMDTLNKLPEAKKKAAKKS